MSDLHQDPELRSRFAELKRLQSLQTPAFADVIARAHQQAARQSSELQRASVFTKRRVGWAGGLAVAAVLAALLVVPRVRSREDEFEKAVEAFNSNPALGSWRSPTDALLNVPGSQLMSTVPAIGTSARNQ